MIYVNAPKTRRAPRSCDGWTWAWGRRFMSLFELLRLVLVLLEFLFVPVVKCLTHIVANWFLFPMNTWPSTKVYHKPVRNRPEWRMIWCSTCWRATLAILSSAICSSSVIVDTRGGSYAFLTFMQWGRFVRYVVTWSWNTSTMADIVRRQSKHWLNSAIFQKRLIIPPPW